MKPTTILAFAPGVWNWEEFTGSPRYHLWTLASMGHTVVYTEPPNRLLMRTAIRSAPDRPFHVVSPALVPPFAVSRMPNHMLAEPWRKATSQALAHAGISACCKMGLSPGLLWLGAPWQSRIAAHFPPEVPRVQFVYDELAVSYGLKPWQAEMLEQWEAELRSACAMLICNSRPIAEKRIPLHSCVRQVDNAIRDDFLSDNPPFPSSSGFGAMVDRLSSVPRPRIVYGGVADPRLDPAIFGEIASSTHCASLVFLGTHSPAFTLPVADPERVHFMGRVPYSGLPHLYRHASVLVIAHRRMPFTEAMYPAKLTEYLSSGKPIVSVSLPEVRRVETEARIRGTILFADTPGDFTAAINRAIVEDTPELAAERRRLAAQRTWSAAGRLVESFLEEIIR